MKTRARPEKFLTRKLLDRQTHAPDDEPPPDLEEIQRQLGRPIEAREESDQH